MKTTRMFDGQSDRYAFDFGVCRGFAQIDTCQDASYYGSWACPFTLQVVSYCEGDITINQTEDPAEFVQELRSIKAWNDAQGYKCAIDGMCNEKLIAKFEALGVSDLLH